MIQMTVCHYMKNLFNKHHFLEIMKMCLLCE
jgi:hypothetical protein